MRFYLLWLIITCLLFLFPILLSIFYEWKIDAIPKISLNAYILWSLFHFLLQIFFSFLNRYKINHLPELNEENKLTIGIQMVGYQENPKYLNSAFQYIYKSNPQKFIFISDGNSEDDEYILDIFQKNFAQNYMIKLDNFFHNYEKNKKEQIIKEIQQHQYICILQPHKNKRHALYTGFEIYKHLPYDYLLLSDSDTMILPDTCYELSKVLYSNPKCMAVTGDVRIFNTVNFLSFIISLKYWIAFHIERGAQSFHGVVSCIAGPLGLYKKSILLEIKDVWLKQTFCGRECTFGDDRHLTNLILSKGHQVLFTHKAICYTETPTTIKRWVLQQVRWGKSFIREFWLNINWFHKQNLWLAYDLIFLSVYSLFLLVLLVIILFSFNIYLIIFLLYGIIIVSGFRGIYAAIMTKNIRFLYFSFYGLIYIFILLPLKLWSILTLTDIEWGTSTRKIIKDTKNINMFPVILWNLIGIIGIGITMYIEIDKIQESLFLFLCLGLFLFCFVFYLSFYIFEKNIKEIPINIPNDS